MKRSGLPVVLMIVCLLERVERGASQTPTYSPQHSDTTELPKEDNNDIDQSKSTLIPSEHITDVDEFSTETNSEKPQNFPDSQMPQNANSKMPTEKEIQEMTRESLAKWNMEKARRDMKIDFTRKILTELRNLSKSAPVNRGAVPPPLVRKDIRLMTWKEWREFCAALQRISVDRPDPSYQATWYDVFAGYHRSIESPSAHGGAGFIAWHALYLKALENALRRVNYNVRLPVWDSRPDTQIPNHCDSALFTADLIGNAHGQVTKGPLGNRRVYHRSCQAYGTILSRDCYNFAGPYTLTSYEYYEDVTNNYARYSDFVRPFNPGYEDNHGGLHVAVRGHVSALSCAANDPLFYMLHGFLQAMFDIAMDNRYSYNQQVQLQYPSSSNMDTIHRGDNLALPFDVTHRQALQDAMASNLHYNLVPDTCRYDIDCNPTRSDMNAYWCKVSTGRCASKIRIGGLCAGNDGVYPHKACFKESFCVAEPSCKGGYCVCKDSRGRLVSTPSAP